MSSGGPSSPRRPALSFQAMVAVAFGFLLAICLLKLGNPVILAKNVEPPSSLIEVLIWAWPLSWGYPILLVVGAIGVLYRCRNHETALRNPAIPRCRPVFLWLPLVWLGLQGLSALGSVRPALTLLTLEHFAATVACFYLGYLVLARLNDLSLMWIGTIFGFIGMISTGFDQHFGGLEATRQFLQRSPDWPNQPAEFVQKVMSNRIYGTMFYPNTLAGAILLFTPLLLAIALTLPRKRVIGWSFGAVLTVGASACLYWSGSKSGWLIALGLVLAAGARLALPLKVKILAASGFLLTFLAIFLVAHASYFDKGASSIGARFDYWRAALKIVSLHPVFGSGPGTFGVLYRELKPPKAEMTRLAHNDYLQQAADSGLASGLAYLTILIGSLGRLYSNSRGNRLRFAVWLGLSGWAAQSFVEFGLYVPAIAWPGFLLLGWLWGSYPAEG